MQRLRQQGKAIDLDGRFTGPGTYNDTFHPDKIADIQFPEKGVVFFAERLTVIEELESTAAIPQVKESNLSHGTASRYAPGDTDFNGIRLFRFLFIQQGYGFLRPPKFLSGGGGLTSTARDYMRFCQMLLNKGHLDGVRILEAETVEEMTRDHLPQGVKAGEGAGFGLGFSVQLQPDPSGQVRVGEYGWAGAASTFFGISPQDDTVVLILTQYMPFNNQIPTTLKPLVYAALNEN